MSAVTEETAPAAAPDAEADTQDGLTKIVGAGFVSYERLPMLEIVFDRLVRVLATSLRNLTNDNVEISIEKLVSLRFGDYMNSIPMPAMLTVFQACEWDNNGVIVADSALIYSIVDVLLGGRGGAAPAGLEGRTYTLIERGLVERVAAQVLADLSISFEPICKINFRLDRTEINPRFAAIARPSNAAMLVRLRLDMDGRGGCIDIVLPFATLEPVRDLLLQQFMGERLGRDNIWEAHLAEDLRETSIELDAVLGEQSMTLADVLDLKIGSQIVFGTSAEDPIQLRCGWMPMFTGRTGNRRGRIAVQIEERLVRQSTAPMTGDK